MKNNSARILLGCVLGFCAFAIILFCIGYPYRKKDDSSILDETTTTTEETTTTTTVTTATMTESETSTTTTTTRHLMIYDIRTRIDMITMLLDQADYQRLIDKAPEDLTSDERLEIQYYSCLVFERKQLREYLEKQAEIGDDN